MIICVEATCSDTNEGVVCQPSPALSTLAEAFHIHTVEKCAKLHVSPVLARLLLYFTEDVGDNPHHVEASRSIYQTGVRFVCALALSSISRHLE
jgi:hypothetical protein